MRKLSVCGIAALALVAAGCGGGGDDDSDTEASAPTKSEYIADADQVCTEKLAGLSPLTEEQRQAREQLTSSTSAAEAKQAAGEIASVLRRTVVLRDELTAELEAIPAPEGAPPTAYLEARKATSAAMTKEAAAQEKYSKAPTEANSAAITATNKQLATTSEGDVKTAGAYGFKVCGRPIE